MIIRDSDIEKSIKKKRNWSATGPDMIVNFWLKKLIVIYTAIKSTFMNFINSDCELSTWFCGGRTSLLEKPGEWAYSNTRPITCTNTIYKWFTSILLIIHNKHAMQYEIMQLDQRGAKEKCSGTTDNLLIDGMVLKDAHDSKRNLACGWVDVKKAYDSVSHSWILKMLELHRFPLKLQNAVAKLLKFWNTVLVVPLENEDKLSPPIPITNGVFQGDVYSGDLFKLSLNPVSWELRRYEGYKMSKPLACAITHLLFMDDLKNFTENLRKLVIIFSEIKLKMEDGGLDWNSKKCKVMSIVRGMLDTSQHEITLFDGTKIECLSSQDLYKFLGVPENLLHDVEDIISGLEKVIKQRTSVIWTSPLSDSNKISATNMFVLSSVEYFMRSEKFNITTIREMDQIIRDVLNSVHAKYSLQMNASLYLARKKGGRGLRNFETTYKKGKVKAAMNLLTSNDPRMRCVKLFEEKRIKNNRSSVIKDAQIYAKEDFDIDLEQTEEGFLVHYKSEGKIQSTSDKKKVASILNINESANLVKELTTSTWQGVILNTRYNDTTLVSQGCFTWLTKWNDCPVNIINDFQNIYLQTVPTQTFKKHRGHPNLSTVCRVCKSGTESVKHLLSNCTKFLTHEFKRRHDRALQFIMFNFLSKYNLIDASPPWYSKVEIKPMYEKDDITVYWDIPEYSGYADETEQPLRPDGKIVNRKEKVIFLLEMTVPWIENRESKEEEKVEKYQHIVQSLKIDNPGYDVKQLTFVIDCLGGYSKSLPSSLRLMKLSVREVDSVILGIQKIIVTEAVSLINRFKVLTKE